MTFTEYLNQTEPQRNPRVIITENDCDTLFTNAKGDTTISLTINERRYYYVMTANNPRFWTIDSDGNKKSRSCFYFHKCI
jgi:hypothetical protein